MVIFVSSETDCLEYIHDHVSSLNVLLGEEFHEKVLSTLVKLFQRNIKKVEQLLAEMDASFSHQQKIFVDPEEHIESLHKQASFRTGIHL